MGQFGSGVDRVAHCGGGPGPSHAPFFKTLVDWVENGKVPDRVELQSPADVPVKRTAPACLYPQRAVYVDGDPNSAESYRCKS